jgi:predicted HTH transcriptional regulator
MLETISAFANSNGGEIFVGIEENKNGTVKEIVGIRISGKEIENLSNEIHEFICICQLYANYMPTITSV